MKINASKIELLLAEQGLTRIAWAELCGVSRQNLSAIMTRGTCEPRTAGKLAKSLSVSVAEIARQETA